MELERLQPFQCWDTPSTGTVHRLELAGDLRISTIGEVAGELQLAACSDRADYRKRAGK